MNVSHFLCVLGKNESLPESLKRIEKLTGKKVKFYEVTLLDKDALSKVFVEVSE